MEGDLRGSLCLRHFVVAILIHWMKEITQSKDLGLEGKQLYVKGVKGNVTADFCLTYKNGHGIL
jgi:hypothetical protein